MLAPEERKGELSPRQDKSECTTQMLACARKNGLLLKCDKDCCSLQPATSARVSDCNNLDGPSMPGK